MMVVHNDEELMSYVKEAASLSEDQPILIDQYIEGTEVEVDAIADRDDILVPGIMEHIERTGVHSGGDSFCVYPPQNLSDHVIDTVMEYTRKIAKALQVVGLMNIQFVVKDEKVYIIEVNPRASRTVPILSKVTKVPMVKLAMQVILGEKLSELDYGTGLYKTTNLIAVKAPVFSFVKLAGGVDAALTPEMKSTGEVLGIDTEYDKAMLKAFKGAGFKFRTSGKVLVSVADPSKEESLSYVKELQALGLEVIASKGTSSFLSDNGVNNTAIDINDLSDIQTMMKNEEIAMMVNIPTKGKEVERSGYKLRNLAEHLNVSSFSCLDTVEAYIMAMKTELECGNEISYDVINAYL